MKRTPVPANSAGRRVAYWRATRRLTLTLLIVWTAVTIGLVVFARELSDVRIWGWPFSFFAAAQGATLVYVAIVGFYAWCMQRLDRILTEEGKRGD